MTNYKNLYGNLIYSCFFLFTKAFYFLFSKPLFILIISIGLFLKLFLTKTVLIDKNFKIMLIKKKVDIGLFVLLFFLLSANFSNIKTDLGLLITLYFFLAFSIGYFVKIEKKRCVK